MSDVSLNDLATKGKIQITVDTDQVIIVKRDGSEEPYTPEKMKKVIDWATDNNEFFTNELLEHTEIKLYPKMHIAALYDEVIKSAANKISLLYPQWEYIAAKLYLLKLYKESWGISDGTYPNFLDVLDAGVDAGIYDRSLISKYTAEELEEIGSFIDQKRDYLFTWKALLTHSNKYCLNISNNKKLELPQHVYLRVAMALHVNSKDRLDKIYWTYTYLSNHLFTVATPISINAGTPNANLASCVLTAIDDDSKSILDGTKNLGIYSKFKGGTAADVSKLRAKGSYIKGNQGYSSGPVPFIKIIESTMKAFNQGGKRPGSCAVYFQWWHKDFNDLIVLKSNGGTDENRARGLKYAVKINNLFLDRVIEDKDIALFDPKDVTSLFGTFGAEFEEKYKKFEKDPSIPKTIVKARDIWYRLMKERTETGNIYLFHEENVNVPNMLGRYVNSSNLCMEIVEPSRPSKTIGEHIWTNEAGKQLIQKHYTDGEIALCNLASINLEKYYDLPESDREDLIYLIVETMDNTIDLAYYPVKEGAITNKKYRYLGIGVNNYVNCLASKFNISIMDEEAKNVTKDIFEELSYNILNASNLLAVEKGKFPEFDNTRWAKGELPVFNANKNALALVDDLEYEKWEELAENIKTFGLRNALTMAIAPTATSGKAINATESIEPVQNFLYREEGTFDAISLVPNFRKNNKYYIKALDCDQKKLIELAAIRQIFLDQAQSINLYYKHPDSLLELTKDHLYAFKLGIKTLYYIKQEKGDEEVCESCT